ncbi:MAG: insulinase family protein [Deltaproteobacteria bacterium]|nr:MAG: insulinase family protein [Deltaproteobacteria bacterium]
MKLSRAIAFLIGLVLAPLASAVAAPPAPAAPARPAPPRAAPPAPAQPARPTAAPPRQVTSVEGITEYALGNGLRVLLFPDPSKETFTVNVTYLVGSRMEGYGETGMAHLLEHMLFKGSPRHPKIWEELEQRGADNNATTDYDRTNYFETLPVKGDNLAWALELEADRMLNASIAQADLDKEFSVVRNEFEIGENDPSGILSERMWSTAYLWHNYGKSVIGSRADIEKVPATTLKRFYKKYYRPDNAVLIVAGKFDATTALGLITTHFGNLANPAAPIEPTYTTEPVQDGERVVSLRRNGDVQVVGLVYHVSAAAEADFAAVRALADVLTSEPSGRLYVALVKSGLATSVTSRVQPLHDPGVIELDATLPANKSIEAVRDKMIAVVESVAKSKITDIEVARFKAKSKKQFKLRFANSQQLCITLSEYIAAGDWRLLFLQRDRVAQLTADDVQKAAAAYLVPSNRTLGMFFPTKAAERAPQRETPDIAKVVAGYKGAPPEAEGEKFDASLDNIEKRTARSVLASGMKLAILAKQTRGHVVRAHVTLHYGTEADFTGNRAAASLVGEMLARGTRRHSFQQLKDQWDVLEAQVGFSARPGAIDVNIQTTRDNLGQVLAQVDEVLREPAFPQDQFDIVVKDNLTQLDDQKSDPQAQAFTTASRALAPYPPAHPLYIPTTVEAIAELKALHLADLKKFPAMFGTGHATMTIVGDVDTAAIKPWIERTWGSWKSPRPYKRIARRYTATAAGEQVLDFPDKANAWIAAVHAIDMKDDDPDAPAMDAAGYTLGGGGFVSRLLTRLRQKDGLSYAAFSGFQLDSLDPVGVFFAAGALNPENAKKGMAAMTEEIVKLVSGGVTAEELSNAKSGLQQAFDRDLSNDGVVLRLLHDGLYVDRKLDFWTKHNAAVAALTVDQVNAAIKRHLKPDSLAKITAGDQKKM